MSEDERIVEFLIKSDIDLINPNLVDLVDAFKLGALHGWWVQQEEDSDYIDSREES